MSEAQYTGFQFYHDPEFAIDPRLLENDEGQNNLHIDYAQFSAYDGAPSTEKFELDVEQAVRSQNSQFQSCFSLENVPTTPTNLSLPTSSLNPRALPFRPQQYPGTPLHTVSEDYPGYPHLSGASINLCQAENSYEPPSELALEHDHGPEPSAPSHGMFSMQRPNAEAIPGPQTPAAPRRLYASVLGTRGARFNPGGQLMAYEAAGNASWSQPSPYSGTTMAMSSANVARLPIVQDAFGQMNQWNQNTYQGPALRTSQLQFPPTPSASGRGRSGRGGSVSTQAGNHQCDVCQKMFPSRHELNHHKRWHEKGFACELCDKVFSAAKDLRRHFRAKHNRAERHLFCNILGCKFRQKGFHRLDHLKRHHERKHSEFPWSPPATSSFGGG